LSGEKTEPAGPFFWAAWASRPKARKEKSRAVKMAGDFRLSEFFRMASPQDYVFSTAK
jgi:hypothetical protein